VRRKDDDSASESGVDKAGAELRGGTEAGQQRQAGEATLPARNGVGERAGCEYVDDEGR